MTKQQNVNEISQLTDLFYNHFIGILSPPGAFLTPSPSPSVAASPRLQPSPCLSPFSQDVLLVAGNHLTNNCVQDQVFKMFPSYKSHKT